MPKVGLPAGAEGAIVHVYHGGAGYEVEFLKGRSLPAVVTVTPQEIELLKDE
jgi:hypothetical protein